VKELWMSDPEKMCVECYRCVGIDLPDGEWTIVASAFDAREWYEWRCGYCAIARRLRTTFTTRPAMTLRAGRVDTTFAISPSIRAACPEPSLSMWPGY
jgi:hypothetical protein